MASVIRASDHQLAAGVAFNFDDMTAQAKQYLDRVRIEAAKIVTQAQKDGEAIRRRAEQEGRQAGMALIHQATEQNVAKQMEAILPALRQAIDDLRQAKQSWLVHWEGAAVHVAAAIAGRVIRRELTRRPEISLTLVREALELAAGSPQVRIHLSPADHLALGQQIAVLTREMAGLGEVEILADPAITGGGCRVETRFGTIDQQIESQLARLEEELTL